MVQPRNRWRPRVGTSSPDQDVGEWAGVDRDRVDRFEWRRAVLAEQTIFVDSLRQHWSKVGAEDRQGDMMDVARRGVWVINPQSEAVAEPGCVE